MDTELDNLVKELFDWLVQRNPMLGTVFGLHEYDALLPDGSREAALEDIETQKDLQRKFESLDDERLSPMKRIEKMAMLQRLRTNIFIAEEYRQWESNPTAIDTLGECMFLMYSRDFAPLEERLESITSRLEKAPRFLEESKTKVIKPIRLWVEIQLESTMRFPMLLDEILRTAKDVLTEEKLEALERAVQDTKNAVMDYGKWMQESLLPKAEEEYRMGKEKLTKLIELKHLGYSVPEIREIGEGYLEECKNQLVKIAEEIKPGSTVEEARDLVKSKHPKTFQEAMEDYRDSIVRSKKFLQENDLITIPPGEELLVTETPEYLRNIIPYAAYFMSGKFDEKQTGIYVVTPFEEESDIVKEHSYAAIMNTSVHEGYPGHHLQLVMTNMNPSLVPLLSSSTEMVEGWAHYCEDWMKEKGFDDTPDAWFVRTTDLVWRAARIIVDIDLHSRKMTVEEAADFLVEQVGMERDGAFSEARRYTLYPAYQLCYLMGKHLFVKLREKVKERMGDRYDDRFFHDTILSTGSLPIHLLDQVFEFKLQEMAL